ncbi:NAD(P)-binding protein [Nemania sp. NC0429]|nr:NAD(P)-binding protein [Nemania sp. NC0429]
MSAAQSRPLTWLITGASSGIGQSLCKAALVAGHKVAGGTRDVSKARAANPDFESLGGKWVTLDPGHADSATAFAAVDLELGGVDVLVNNAAYAYIGGVEDMSEDKIREQMEVNFFGPMRGVRALLPGMRARRRGDIVLISSGAGFIARASRGAYSASKWAVEAMHESLSHEVAGLGVRVLIVEPGAFRTAFAARSVMDGTLNEGYKGTALDTMYTASSRWDQGQNSAEIARFLRGDPDKAASAVVDAVVAGGEGDTLERGYLRLVLGPDCVGALEEKLGEWERDISATREVSMSTDLDNPEA